MSPNKVKSNAYGANAYLSETAPSISYNSATGLLSITPGSVRTVIRYYDSDYSTTAFTTQHDATAITTIYLIK